MQRLAAGREELHGARRRERLREQRGGVEHLLEVVDHEEELLLGEVRRELLPGRLVDAERLRDLRQDELGIGDRRERHEEDAVREVLDQLGRRLQREPGLPGAARPGQRDRADVGPAQELDHLGDLAVAPDERRRLHGQVRRPVLERAERREPLGQPVEHQLEQALRLGQVLQPVLAEVREREPGVLLGQQVVRGVRDQHLPAVPGRADPRAPVDPDPDVALRGRRRLGGVDAHPDPELPPVRPRVAGEGSLPLARRPERVARPREGDEEGVALRVDLVPAVRRERLAEEPPVILEHRGVPLGAEVPQQPRRALDVREQEGDGPARPLGHPRMMARPDASSLVGLGAERRRDPVARPVIGVLC